MNQTDEFQAKRFQSSLDIRNYDSIIPNVPRLRPTLDISVFSTLIQDRIFMPAPDFLLTIAKKKNKRIDDDDDEEEEEEEIFISDDDDIVSMTDKNTMTKKRRKTKKRKNEDDDDDEEDMIYEEIDSDDLMEIDQSEFQKHANNENRKSQQQQYEDLDFPLDSFFKKRLKPHQLEGLKFMWKQVYEERHGCLLSHSMGLGKTIQTIALLTTLYQKRYYSTQNNDFPMGKKVLILAPLTTITNWVNELFMWRTSDMDTILGEIFNFYDLGSRTRKQTTRINILRHWHESGGILLMSYGQFRILVQQQQEQQEAYNYYLVNPGPDVVVLDEAHVIKSATSQISQLVKQFKTTARICLTGYPLQNNLKEYYYMLDFIAPGILGTAEQFNTAFASWVENIYADTSKNLQMLAQKKLYALQLVTSRVTHRRDRSILEVDLPVKKDIAIHFKLSTPQYTGYVKLLMELKSSHVSNPLAGLPWLRAICNHPKIFQRIMRKKAELKDLIKEAAQKKESIFIDTDRLRESNDDNPFEPTDEELLSALENKEAIWAETLFGSHDIESWKCSGKMTFTLDLAKKCKEAGEKLVLVSHSLVTLDFVQRLLLVFGINVNRLDGSTPQEDRQAIIDEFHVKESIHVILLSAKAAAIGINVTCANRIVLIDQDWNPLYDEQSIGRIYRYGQQKPVFVYRLLTQTTIEEAISSQSIHKSTIARQVIDNKSSLLQLKQNLKKYYKVPIKDLPSVELEAIEESILEDPITAYAIKENQGFITDIKPYSLTPAVNDMSGALTDKDRTDAKNEAKKILSTWLSRNKMMLMRNKKKKKMNE